MTEKKEYTIPKSHPRYRSLKLREELVEGVESGLTAFEGLIAHGRGEAFDYLLCEMTIPSMEHTERVAAAQLLLGDNPVISVNGNVAALAVSEVLKLSQMIPAKIEVNIFHYTENRFKAILSKFRDHGAKRVLGEERTKQIPGLDHSRAACTEEGIYNADVVLVPLEDGDRAQALKNMGKTVITIDLNPLSRTARTCDITIVDNIIRALPNMTNFAQELKNCDKSELYKLVDSFDNSENLKECLKYICNRISTLEVEINQVNNPKA